MNVALLQSQRALWVEVWEWLQLRRLANSLQEQEGGGCAIFAAGMLLHLPGSLILRKPREIPRHRLVSRIIYGIMWSLVEAVRCDVP